MAFAAGNGWQSEGGGWKYYKDGAPLKGVNWIEAEGGRYIFNENGLLQTGDAEGDVLINGNLYHINPDKNLSDPKSCYAVRNYTRKRDAGVTYYDGDGITFVGWISAGDGKLMYQTLVPKENVPGATKDIYIYVWRAQYISAGKHPTTGAAIDAGWYLFGDDGILINTDGTHSCNDGSTYTVSGGKITAKDGQPVGTPAQQPATTPPQGETVPDGHTHNWATRHIDEVGHMATNGTHQVFVTQCDCGFIVTSDDPDAQYKWEYHRSSLGDNCHRFCIQWSEDCPNDPTWVVDIPAHDETYCTICGAVR